MYTKKLVAHIQFPVVYTTFGCIEKNRTHTLHIFEKLWMVLIQKFHIHPNLLNRKALLDVLTLFFSIHPTHIGSGANIIFCLSVALKSLICSDFSG